MEDLSRQGVELWFEGEQLCLRTGEVMLSEDQVSRIRANSAGIVQYLRAQAAAPQRSCELSCGQQAIWLTHQLEPESPVHNLSFVARVHSKVNVEALKSSVQALVDRHEILRTGYAYVDGVTSQRIAGLGVGVFKTEHISSQTDEEIDAIVQAEHRRPFDLAGGTVFRVSLLAPSEADQILIISIHHIAIDGWSYTILLDELFKLYRERAGGAPAVLSKLSVSYSDYCTWQSEMLAGPEGDRLWTYWKDAISALRKPLNLPLDKPRPATRSFEGKAVSFVLEPAMSERVKQLARQEGTTAFVILLACFHALLYKLTGSEDVTVGTPALARKKSQYLRIVGEFSNTLPIRGLLAPNMKFSELARQVHQSVREAMDAQEFPFSLMVQRLRVKRDLSRSPLFDCVFLLHRFHKYKEIDQLMFPVYPIEDGDVVELGGLQLSPYPFNHQEGQYDLTLQIIERSSAFRATLKYSTDLFVESTIRKFSAEYVDLVDMVTRDPEIALGSVRFTGSDMASAGQPIPASQLQNSDVDGDRSSMSAPRGAVEESDSIGAARRDEISAPEQKLVMETFNDTAAPLPEKTLAALFEDQVARTPDVTAVVYEGQRLTYAELDDAANRLAHRLIAERIGPESLVSIAIDRSLEMVIALLGIVKAGAAYLPLDPEYPTRRLQFMLRDSNASLLLTTSKMAQHLELGGDQSEDAGVAPLLFVDAAAVRADLATRPNTAPSDADRTARLSPANLAYVIYTSGSTGEPKGVATTQANVGSLAWRPKYAALGPGQAVLQLAPVAFDAATFEIWGALLNGARLVLAPAGPLDLERIAQTIFQHGVDTLWLTAGLFRQIVETHIHLLAGLKQLLAGGDVLPVATVRRVKEQYPELTVINGYGPTETTTFACTRVITNQDLDAERIPIGSPIANTRVYVLDGSLLPVPIGVAGELYISGAGLARGYLNRPELTAERFIACPFGPPGERMYRTGDLARWRSDGAVDFLGRADSQVKIRGFRVEPGEIETVLTSIAGIAQAVVIAREIAGDTRLIAYLVARPDANLPPAVELRAVLVVRLPLHMIPSAFVPIDALPLTINGKLDRERLPMPKHDTGGETLPLTKIEGRLAEIWKDILGLDAVGKTDDFFELGGHSLLALRLLNIVETEFGRRVDLATLFESPTIECFALAIERGAGQQFDFRKVVRLHPSSTRPQIFGINNTGAYYLLAKQLGPEWPLTALQLFDPSYPVDRMPETMEEIAAQYVQLIRRLQPKGPYNLLSWCAGGILTMEVAYQLLAANEEISFLAIIEGYAPFQYKRFNWLRTKLAVNSFRFQWNLAEFMKVRSGELSLRKFLTNRRSLQAGSRFGPFRGSKAEPEAAAYELWLMASYLNSTAKKYQLKTFPGRIHLFRASLMPKGLFLDDLNGWGGYAAEGVEVSFIEGDHHSIFRPPGVDQLAKKMSAALAAAIDAHKKTQWRKIR